MPRIEAIEPLFHSPLSLIRVDDADRLNHQLKAEAWAMQANSPGLQRSNLSGWHSEDDLFDRPEPGCQQLCRQIVDSIGAVTRQMAPDFDLASHGVQLQGWINMSPKGALNTPHDHPNWVWSGCYYVNVPSCEDEHGGCIEFMDTRTNVRTLSIDGARCFASKHRVRPQAGSLLIFPSYLRHWVYPNTSDEVRISIAFNARFVKR